MSFQAHFEEETASTPEPVSFKVRVLRSVFGLLIAAGSGLLLYWKVIPAWLGGLLIFLGAHFVSQSLTISFAKYIIKPLADAIKSLK